jgi:hypothetical protein
LTSVLPSAADPRILLAGSRDPAAFSEAVSTFKFGTTLKTTQSARFPQTLQVLSQLEFAAPPVILDVGASDASTSLDVMHAVPFSKYYVTDANMTVSSSTVGKRTYFYDGDGECVLIASNAWVAYRDTAGALPIFASLARSLFSRAPALPADAHSIQLVNPALASAASEGVRVEPYDMFDQWTHEPVDLVIAANILNRSYFADAEITRALRNLVAALKEGGRLAIVDNRPAEKTTVFQKRGDMLHVEKRVGAGTDIEALALESSVLSAA